MQAKLNRQQLEKKEAPKKTLEELKHDAEQKQMDFEMQNEFNLNNKEVDVILEENIETSSKAFYKEFKKVKLSLSNNIT